MVIHDTECPYWDQVLLNNTNLDPWVFVNAAPMKSILSKLRCPSKKRPWTIGGNVCMLTHAYTIQVQHFRSWRRGNPLNSYSASHDNRCTETLLNRVITAQREGMGDVGAARYEPALLPPCLTIRVLSYNNCQRSTHSIIKWIFRNLAL